MEYVPVVDEDDDWLYSVRREIVHDEENPLWHRSVTVLTFASDDRERLLIQRRSAEKERKPGYLEFTGGHVEAGEEYREAAIREYAEELLDRPPSETSIEPEDFTELERIDKVSPDNREKVAVYSTVYDGPFDLSEEVETAWYAPVEDVMKDIEDNPQIFTNSAVRSFEKYFEDQSTNEPESISNQI